ncbi:2-hydroxyacid dehydrogenase [Sphingomonas bacterium]|uniref:2-hydroxyacid dehydrogenase n=1 Tax=Sphingomonas bacterium TaxID=1895847 RepID=UPI001575EB71|nr:D-glycerate dehydrogenase [Sphingomonas bacterium]
MRPYPDRSPRLFVSRRWPGEVEQALAARYDVTLNEPDAKLGRAALVQAMRTVDILCPTVSDTIDHDLIASAGATVRLIANYGAGVDHIDLEAARAADILVSNTPDVLTDATAELAVLLILMASRRAGEGERELRAGRWAGWRPTHLLGQGVNGKVLGLVGFGRIGQMTAARAHALGMRIAYHAPRRASAAIEAEHEAQFFASLDELATRADVISLHCRGGAETRHLVDARLLALMKPTAILVNTARGTVVNEHDLAVALAAGRIAAAGLDVFEREPAVDPALLALDNVVLLPHLGSATRDTRVAMGMRVVANIERFVATGEVLDRVA